MSVSMEKITQSKSFRLIAITLCVFLFGIILFLSGVCNFLEYKTYDNRLVVTSKLFSPSEDISFIVLDQESLDWGSNVMGWSWPWPRSAYGDIVNYLNIGNASCVVFDVLYTEPSIYGTEDDNSFANACEAYGKVIQTMFISGIGSSEKVLLPIDPILKSAALVGNIVSALDEDDIIRRGRLLYEWQGKEYPSLGTAPLFLKNRNQDTVIEDTVFLKEMFQDIPVLKDSTVYLRYQNNIENYIPYRASDILESYYDYQNGEEPLIEPENFADSYVFFAFYAPGLFDICSTPVSQVYPGVGVHITLLDNILNNSFIKPVSTVYSIFWILLVSFLGAFIVYIGEKQKTQSRTVVFTVFMLVLVALLIVAITYVLFIPGYWIPLVVPAICFVSSFLSILILSYATEGKQKRFIKTAFSQYLSPIVIEELIADPHRLKLGGERREISIFFSDVQGFTSISEKLSPESLTELLNDFLSEMSDIILKSGGTIDKYEGDAIIAFWNAPIEQCDHGRRAIEAALECQKRLEELRTEFQKRAGTPMFMRIGLNTGNAVVGNMGSRNRFDYTMLGDSVNLGARLEGLNKQFGTYIMCSEATRKAAIEHECSIEWRELAKVAVVGKNEAVTVFEPLSKEEYESKKDVLHVFDIARTLFYKGNFQEALKAFKSIEEHDKPAFYYCKKCQELIQYPPENWEGVWKATEK